MRARLWLLPVQIGFFLWLAAGYCRGQQPLPRRETNRHQVHILVTGDAVADATLVYRPSTCGGLSNQQLVYLHNANATKAIVASIAQYVTLVPNQYLGMNILYPPTLANPNSESVFACTGKFDDT